VKALNVRLDVYKGKPSKYKASGRAACRSRVLEVLLTFGTLQMCALMFIRVKPAHTRQVEYVKKDCNSDFCWVQF